MIVFENIKWKNFLSTGQQGIEVNLNKDPTTLIIGHNGAGKSTILDALCFGLFNKPFREIKKEQLINSINLGGTEISIEFSIAQNKYKVIRGIKPNIFQIYLNGEMINQEATIADQQKHLENNILKFNYRSFTQVVILGSSTFVPFMELKAPHRREVVEDILDIKIFSVMNMLVKMQIKEVTEISNQVCKVKLDKGEILANPISVKAKGDKTTVSIRPERALINPTEKMDNNHKGSIEEVIYHGDHTRVRLKILGNPEFILKVANSSKNLDIKPGNEINIGWNSQDARALDPK